MCGGVCCWLGARGGSRGTDVGESRVAQSVHTAVGRGAELTGKSRRTWRSAPLCGGECRWAEVDGGGRDIGGGG